MEELFLICNAHLDPVWLWQWEEGAAETLSTFRTAVDICEKYDSFVFNHNEAVLYQWVEEFDPELFMRIQNLVEAGKWNIMGGWYLQPDCNMPSGESLVRQILFGRIFFKEKFNSFPKTAINFDSFGHSRGIVQLLVKSGYKNYIHCRPDQSDCSLPSENYLWVGFDGSEILAHRSFESYLSLRGEATNKIRRYIDKYKDKKTGMVLWGIGDHGGGPSYDDVSAIHSMIDEYNVTMKIHNTSPDEYFNTLRASSESAPRFAHELNPWAPGCYTSQIQVKQEHRFLENLLFMTEKMCSIAALFTELTYPQQQFHEVIECLLFSEFHDILAGTIIPAAQVDALRQLGHGIDILMKLRIKAFLALCNSQPKARQNELPIMVYNPHPYQTKVNVECEFNLADQNWDGYTLLPEVYLQNDRIISQLEKEESNIRIDWRKKVVFKALLPAMSICRFDCRFIKSLEKMQVRSFTPNENFVFDNSRLHLIINSATGKIDELFVDGTKYLEKSAFTFVVLQDSADSWGSTVRSFTDIIGEFMLMSPYEGSKFSGLQNETVHSVRLVEDGDVRTIIEVLLNYSDSFIVVNYKLPKEGTEIEIEARVIWQEKNCMIKLCLPIALQDTTFASQTVYGIEEYDQTSLRLPEDELVSQRYILARNDRHAISILISEQGSYGFSRKGSELRLTLLRSPAFSSLSIMNRNLVPPGRFTPRTDQGEFIFKYALHFGERRNIERSVERNAQIYNEPPFALSFFPSGSNKTQIRDTTIKLSDETITLSTFKQAEDGNGFILRLFNPTDSSVETKLSLTFLSLQQLLVFNAFEIKTFRLLPESSELMECNLLEDPL